jgi:hypothetical protein
MPTKCTRRVRPSHVIRPPVFLAGEPAHQSIDDARGGVRPRERSHGARHPVPLRRIGQQLSRGVREAVGRQVLLLDHRRRSGADEDFGISALVVVGRSWKRHEQRRSSCAASSASVVAPAREITRSAPAHLFGHGVEECFCPRSNPSALVLLPDLGRSRGPV